MKANLRATNIFNYLHGECTFEGALVIETCRKFGGKAISSNLNKNKNLIHL